MAYLIRTRGIDPEIVKGMLQRKMIAEDSAHHNCLFFGRDEKVTSAPALREARHRFNFVERYPEEIRHTPLQ